LEDADFTETLIGFTIFDKVDLSKVKALDKANHFAPSTLDIETFYLSNGQIPEDFLVCAGIPQHFISKLQDFRGSHINYSSCFISYSHADYRFVIQLYSHLKMHDIRCWFAPKSLKIGDRLRKKFDESIKTHDKLLLVLSKNSINSHWVEKEVETAFEIEAIENKQIIFPITIDDTVFKIDDGWAADIRRTRHIGDFRKWRKDYEYIKAMKHLVHDLTDTKSK